MPMFGMGRYGGGMDEEERRRMAAMANSGSMGAQPISMTPGARQSLQNAPRMEEKPKRQSYWQGGDKFTGRDALAAGLAAIGDGLGTWANGPAGGGSVRGLMGGRMSAIEQAKAAQANAQAAMAEEQQRQRERQEGLADYRTKKGIDQDYATAPNVNLIEDEVGNRWRIDPRTGQKLDDKPAFIERAPKYVIQGNAAIRVPNPWAQDDEDGFDELPSGFRVQGGAASNGSGNFR